MKLTRLNFPFEVKDVSDTGDFSGYAAVFNNLDRKGDVLLPGAFTDTLAEWKARDRLPPLLWQHNMDEPIGLATKMEEDATGLLVVGKLLKDSVQRAAEAYSLLKNKVIEGMSFGFQVPPGGATKERGARIVKSVRLWEWSLVTFGANELALVDAVKTALADGDLPTLSEFEDFLREAGFSKTQACAIAGKGLRPLLQGEPGDRDFTTELAQDLLSSLSLNK